MPGLWVRASPGASYFWIFSLKEIKMFLPDRESNPGLPRDRRRSSPLDYRGLCQNGHKQCLSMHAIDLLIKWQAVKLSIPKFARVTLSAKWKMQKNVPILRAGFEPATYGYLVLTTTVHRSTNWAIEGGLARGVLLKAKLSLVSNYLLLLFPYSLVC